MIEMIEDEIEWAKKQKDNDYWKGYLDALKWALKTTPDEG